MVRQKWFLISFVSSMLLFYPGTQAQNKNGPTTSATPASSATKAIKPINCVWSEWGSYSLCSKKCGIGTRERKRTVLQAASQGGAPCLGLTSEVSQCKNADCESSASTKTESSSASACAAWRSSLTKTLQKCLVPKERDKRKACFDYSMSKVQGTKLATTCASEKTQVEADFLASLDNQ